MHHATANLGLPYLYPGQSQKEFTFNEAMARLDILIDPNIEGERPDPPDAPLAGQCWLIAGGATGAFLNHERELASWDGEQWTFIVPRPEMLLFDRSESRFLRYRAGEWLGLGAPASPSGGAVIDVEARQTLEQILSCLKTFGIFS